MEATQATQSYPSSQRLNLASAEDDRSVPLVADKSLAVRVYPDVLCPTRSDDVVVEGELWFRPEGDRQWRRASRFPGRVVAQVASRIDRGDASQTLNFRIPPQFCAKSLEVRARVWSYAAGSADVSGDWKKCTFTFVDVPPLRLKAFGIKLLHRELEMEPPSAAELLQTLNFARKTFPIPCIEIVSYEVLEFSGQLIGTPEDSRRGWLELLVLLSRIRTAGLNNLTHFALLPADIPKSYLGFGAAGVAASYAGDGPAAAQELGHALGLAHAPGGGAPEPDPNYPKFQYYPPGSIGEYGFDPFTGRVYSPRTCQDFMGYGGTPWVSPYTYRALLERLQRPLMHPPDNSDGYLHLGLRVDGQHHCELESGLTLPGPPMAYHAGESGMSLELLDENGEVFAEYTWQGDQLGSGRYMGFVQSIPADDRLRKLVFRCCEHHAATVIEVPEEDLELTLDETCIQTAGQFCEGLLHLRWKVACGSPRRLSFFVRYTTDGGATWQALNAGFDWSGCCVNVDHLPGGENCRLQVIASTLFSTRTAETLPFRVACKPQTATIAYEPAAAGELALQLVGAAHAPGSFSRENELLWFSSLQGFLGCGSYLTLYDCVAGEHEITLSASDGLGGRTQTSVKVCI